MYSPSKNSVVSKKRFSFLVQKHSQRYYDLTQNKPPFRYSTYSFKDEITKRQVTSSLIILIRDWKVE